MTRDQATLLDGLRIMSQIFWGPKPDICAEMLQEPYLQRLTALSDVVKRISEDCQWIGSILNGFAEVDSLCQYLEEGYVRLFINAKEGIVAPLYESCYEFENAPLMGKAAAEMKQRFDAIGLSIADYIQEPPDHISIELEYLYFLLEKGWTDDDKSLVAEAGAFATGNMLPWVSALQERVATEEECLFYPLMGSMLVRILRFIGGLHVTIKGPANPLP